MSTEVMVHSVTSEQSEPVFSFQRGQFMRTALILVGSFCAFGIAFAAPAPNAKFTSIDLKDKVNRKLAGLHNGKEDNAIDLEQGKKKLGEVEFQITGGIIQLGSKTVPN